MLVEEAATTRSALWTLQAVTSAAMQGA